MLSPAECLNRFLFCAEASGDRNETPATRASRKRKARVGKRETHARVAESKRGGVSCGRSASRRLFQGSRVRSRGLQGRAAHAPGNSLPPKVSSQSSFRPPHHRYDEADYNHKSGAMSTRPPPPRISARTGRPYFQRSGKTVRLRQRSARKTGRKTPAVRGTRTPSRRRARTGNFMKSRARKEPLASGPPSPPRRPGPSADPGPAGRFI